MVVQKDEHGRLQRCKAHVNEFLKTSGYDGAEVVFFEKRIQDVVVECLGRGGFDGGVDLLYLDPPWDLPEGFCLATNRGSANKPSEATRRIVARLEREVFGPLLAVRATPAAYVCVKTPTPFEEFRVALFEASPYLRGFVLDNQIKVYNRRGAISMYFIVLRYEGV